jgi:hypothetical protein
MFAILVYQDYAEMRSHLIRAGKQAEQIAWLRRCCDIEIFRNTLQQHIPHAPAHQICAMPGSPQTEYN